MPAAAVIPAPKAYIKVVAAKKLVVGFLANLAGPVPHGAGCRQAFRHPFRDVPEAAAYPQGKGGGAGFYGRPDLLL